MIEVYSREGCGACERVKSRLDTLCIPYVEKSVDEVGTTFIKENFPGKNILPIVVVNGTVYSGIGEIEGVLTEYGQDFGKELLTE